LTNFKNYTQADYQFSDKINCFVGNNGVGKTNLLDAIYYLSFCKSYFNPIDSQNIRHQEDFFAINGLCIRNDDSTDHIQCIQKRNHRKKFLLNKNEYDRLADHIGQFPVVMISPYDRDLINEGSEIGESTSTVSFPNSINCTLMTLSTTRKHCFSEMPY
jgi:DNA replication and repair protein RecF